MTKMLDLVEVGKTIVKAVNINNILKECYFDTVAIQDFIIVFLVFLGIILLIFYTGVYSVYNSRYPWFN